jgi:cysteine-rich repeat protein
MKPRSSQLCFFSFGLTLSVGLAFLFIVLPQVQAATIDVTANVPSGSGAICGNGIVEAGEECDGTACTGDQSCISCICVSTCFVSGTPVTLADGSSKAIEQIKVGDLILSFNEVSQKFEPAEVLKTFKHPAKEYLFINNKLGVTASHPLYINATWQPAGRLKLGDQLLEVNSLAVFVSSVETKIGNFFVYNLTVDKNHNYYAAGFLAHNKGGCTPTICTISGWGPCLNGSQTGTGIDNCYASCSQTRACTVPVCGDGNIDLGEECDDGNTVSGDGCSGICQLEVGCGNGVIEGNEECDDGNIVSGDCCSSICEIEIKIDGVTASPTDNQAVLTWQTPCQATESVLEWGKTIDVNEGLVSGLAGIDYSYTITGLQSDTVYFYRITATAGSLTTDYAGSFRTGSRIEICNNNIDDDGDGLVDIADPNCPCTPTYDCTSWQPQPCPESGIQTRTCNQTNNCWQSQPSPVVSRSCIPGCEISCQTCRVLNLQACSCQALTPCCGNGICENGEDPSNCPEDCILECLSDWQCTAWQPEPCPESGIQTRDCFDRNACPMPIDKPAVEQSCSGICQGLSCGACQQLNNQQCVCENLVPCCGNGICESGEDHQSCPADCIEICLPNWTCSAWGECLNNQQTRECQDLNNCPVSLDRPPESRSCQPSCDLACRTCQQLDLASCSCLALTPCCGNRICEYPENVFSCPLDCGLPPDVHVALSQCLDGLDNDQDKLIDYLGDPGCTSPADDSETDIFENFNKVINLINRFLDNPIVERINRQVAAPALVAVAAVNSFATFSFFNFLTYLQYLLTQPLAALFRRRRKKWGTVYHALTKQPIDLAIVRLYQEQDNKLVQSRVTDKLGRYNFLMEPGSYYLTVTKPKFIFPSQYLKKDKEDVKYLDLYHGEIFTIKENGVDVIFNIPLDPVEETKPVAKIIVQHYLRKLQKAMAFTAVPLAAISAVISPGVLTFVLLGVHCLLFALFYRLGYQKPLKSWGRVYDSISKKPITQAIARVYDKKYNKLLETRVTDWRGRYAFLVNNNVYYVTSEKAGYQAYRSNDLDLISKDREMIIGFDIALKQADASSSSQPEMVSSIEVKPVPRQMPPKVDLPPGQAPKVASLKKPVSQTPTKNPEKSIFG